MKIRTSTIPEKKLHGRKIRFQVFVNNLFHHLLCINISHFQEVRPNY